MRFLNPARPEHLRLGWLAVLVNLIQDQRRSLGDLEIDLQKLEARFAGWWDDSGLVEPPKGTIQNSRRRQTVRMLVTYGLYDEEQERLTDLGLLLQVIRPDVLNEGVNPFVWSGAERWVGLYLYLQTAGDVFFSVFRQWNTTALGLREACTLLERVLHVLASTTRDSTLVSKLNEQASRAEHESAIATLVYPYLEPLRELGYISLQRQGPSERVYLLTDAGSRLKAVLQDDQRPCDLWAKEGISRAFLDAEGLASALRPCTTLDIIQALRSVPPQLTRASGQEISLSTFVVYAQALLIKQKPGTWIDQTLTIQLMEEITRRSSASISFKRGLSVGETHIVWNDFSLLSDPEIGRADSPEEKPILAHAAETKESEERKEEPTESLRSDAPPPSDDFTICARKLPPAKHENSTNPPVNTRG